MSQDPLGGAKTIKCTLIRKTAVTPTPEVVALAAAFGIGTDTEQEMKFFEDLQVTLAPGRLIYIHGESGAGKTSLLREIAAQVGKDFDLIDSGPKFLGPDIPVSKPLISLFDLDTRVSAGILAMAGLGEPFVMLRKPEELSDGQRYRLGIAWAIKAAMDRPRAMLILDEFLAVLDRKQAKSVASNLRRAVDKYRICAVVATTHDDIAADLNPDCIVTLRLNHDPDVDLRLKSIIK